MHSRLKGIISAMLSMVLEFEAHPRLELNVMVQLPILAIAGML